MNRPPDAGQWKGHLTCENTLTRPTETAGPAPTEDLNDKETRRMIEIEAGEHAALPEWLADVAEDQEEDAAGERNGGWLIEIPLADAASYQ